MYWSIWKSWHNRLYYSLTTFERDAFERGLAGLAGNTTIRFTIERNGNVSAVELLSSSGVESLDRAASDAVREVILPPLPVNFPHPRERVTGTFRVNVSDVREWRPSMNYLKRRGYF
jgi:TonB family protein